jgi:tetratricopeptide (TPR) repeat protein
MQTDTGGFGILYNLFFKLLLVVLGLLACTQASAQIDVLDRIDVTPGEEQTEVRIHLNIPMRYKSHAPWKSGDLLRVVVEPVATLGAEEDVLFGREALQWSATDTLPLYEVTYEGSGVSLATISLQFERSVSFEVPPSPDFRSLVIIIKHPAGAARAVTPVQQAAPAAPAGAREYRYALNLASSMEPFTLAALPATDDLLAWRVYTTRFVKDGTAWNRLRLGFFASKEEAGAVQARLQQYYPGSWITPVSSDEIAQSVDSQLAAGAPPASVPEPAPVARQPAEPAAVVPPAFSVPPTGSVTTVDADRVDTLMEQANALLTDKDYDGAVRLYTRILEYPEHAHSQDALEYLGLARERKGQKAQARAVYDSYLEQYPEGDGAARVRQRLAGLLTATSAPKEKLAAAGKPGKTARIWDVFGGFSQFYRRDENTSQIDEEDEVTTLTQSSLSSDLDVTGRMMEGDNDLRTRLTGGYLHDFLEDGTGNESTVSALYFDAQNRRRRMGMRLGRQSLSSGGVLGRFDGLLVELPVTQQVASIALTGGNPVDSARDGFDDNRYFYGASLQLEGFAEGWDVSTFFIQQEVDGITDRRAVGGELRYFDVKKSFFTLLDYDTLYRELNTVQALGNWSFTDRSNLNVLLDYRNSPILTTTNALQGQTADTIDELLQSFSEDEVYELASDRTAVSKLATLGLTRTLDDHWQVSGDVTVSNLSDTPASGGVEAVPGTDDEFFYNLQLIGNNLFKEGDLSVLGLRFGDATTAEITSLSLNTRYPVNADFRVNPRLQVDFRRNLEDDTEQYIIRPSTRLSWNIRRSFRLETELGGEWSDREIVIGSTESSSYFVNLGYRADF